MPCIIITIIVVELCTCYHQLHHACYNKIQNGNILVPANPGPSGKWLLKWKMLPSFVHVTVSVERVQVYKSALPSHTVYTLNMERILSRMTHPSHEELEHDQIYRQEMNLKRDLNTRQRLLCPDINSAP